jgi:hypothetical protein
MADELRKKPTDAVLAKMIQERIPLTLENYVQLAYFGSKTVDDLEAEELAELPEMFSWDGDVVN